MDELEVSKATALVVVPVVVVIIIIVIKAKRFTLICEHFRQTGITDHNLK